MNEHDYSQPPGLQPALAPRIWEYVLGGLMLAVCLGGVLGYHVYHGFITEEIEREKAYWGIGLPFIGVATGVYLFSLGWQRGDAEKAVRMAMFLTLGLLGILVAVLGALSLKRSGRTGGFSWPGLGYTTHRRRPDGDLRDVGHYDEYNDARSIFARRSPGRAGSIEIHCTRCGELFLPQPPGAYCPACGHSAIGRPPPVEGRRSRRRA